MIIEPHAARMFSEYSSLADRVVSLHMFLEGGGVDASGLDADDLALMSEQLIAMAAYAQALGTRLTKYFNNLDYTI
jgi:hypothetical protein